MLVSQAPGQPAAAVPAHPHQARTDDGDEARGAAKGQCGVAIIEEVADRLGLRLDDLAEEGVHLLARRQQVEAERLRGGASDSQEKNQNRVMRGWWLQIDTVLLHTYVLDLFKHLDHRLVHLLRVLVDPRVPVVGREFSRASMGIGQVHGLWYGWQYRAQVERTYQAMSN